MGGGRGWSVPDLKFVAPCIPLLNVDVDWEMGVDVSHLVLVSFCYAGDQVLDDALDCAEGSDVLAGAMVDFDLHDVFALFVLGERECYGDVGEVFCEFACEMVRLRCLGEDW